MGTLNDLASYEEAELVRKRLEACFVGVLTGGDEADGLGMAMPALPGGAPVEPGIYDTNGLRVEKFAPGIHFCHWRTSSRSTG